MKQPEGGVRATNAARHRENIPNGLHRSLDRLRASIFSTLNALVRSLSNQTDEYGSEEREYECLKKTDEYFEKHDA